MSRVDKDKETDIEKFIEAWREKFGDEQDLSEITDLYEKFKLFRSLGAEQTPMRVSEIPIWHKLNLTIGEAAAYSGIGINKIRELSADPECEFALRKGTHTIIKRKQFERYVEELQAI